MAYEEHFLYIFHNVSQLLKTLQTLDFTGFVATLLIAPTLHTFSLFSISCYIKRVKIRVKQKLLPWAFLHNSKLSYLCYSIVIIDMRISIKGN